MSDFEFLDYKGSKEMVIKYTPKYTVRNCPAGNAPFSGMLQIVYKPRKRLLEFGSFELWLKEHIAQQELLIEDVAEIVYDALVEVLQPDYLTLTLTADTIVHATVTINIDTNHN